MLASALDIDDGSTAPMGRHAGHHGALVVPSSLSVAESEGSSGRSFIEAVLVGYEVGIRAGYIMSSFPEGSEAGPMGCHGATVASAKLLQLNKEEIVNALNIVHDHNPMGIMVPMRQSTPGTGAMTKEKIPWATLTGVTAALLAQEGFTGHRSVYQDPHTDLALLSSLGREYKVLEVYYKPYCSCRLTHCALDGLFDVVQNTISMSKISLR